MKYRHLVHVVSLILMAVSAALAVTAAVAFLYGDGDGVAFVIAAAIPLALGYTGYRLTDIERDLSIREGYAVVAFAWLAVGLAGALPFAITGVVESPVAAVFESISGFTTTGATVFGDIEALPHGILLWRSFTQWLGGMGIIVLGIAILPYLGVGGMQLFRAEVPGPTPERLQPRIAQTAKLLWYVYAGMTAAQVTLYLFGGLSLFDAVTHSFSTMSTGGFSPKSASIAAFDSAYVQYVTILFMFLAGVNFALHYRALSSRGRIYRKDAEFRFYTAAILSAATAVAVLVFAAGGGQEVGVERVVRDALFQVVSVGTTTGFVTRDYELWPLGAQLILLTLMLMGGMSGSTGGGVKTVRIHVLLRHVVSELKKSLHPRAVVATRVGSKVVGEPVLLNVLAFLLLFILLYGAGVLALALLGHDLPTAVGASAAAIGNIGPGLGEVGAVDNYGWMGPTSHIVLMFLMVAGRLELFTIFLLFHPDLWRGGRWK
ncbi:MAG: TrkH family potassium uptake protein [Candidatus Longimicrobiales bacterium M2_2A_002]